MADTENGVIAGGSGRKIGLVCEGGGMKCVYGAAVLDRFIDDNIGFKYCVGVSAGTANLASYLAGQRGRNRRFYTEYLHLPYYYGIRSFLRSGDIFGLKYIYGDLSNSDGLDPLDYDAMMINPAEFEIVVANAATGEAVYLNKSDLKRDDYRAIMASCAIPAVCRPVEIDGVSYCDGGMAVSIPVDRAFEKGCDKLVVILSKTRDYVKQPQKHRALYSFRLRKYPKVVEMIDTRHERYNKNFKQVFELERQGKAFVIAPSRRLDVSTYSMDEKAEKELYQLGLDDYERVRDGLLRFLRS